MLPSEKSKTIKITTKSSNNVYANFGGLVYFACFPTFETGERRRRDEVEMTGPTNITHFLTLRGIEVVLRTATPNSYITEPYYVRLGIRTD